MHLKIRDIGDMDIKNLADAGLALFRHRDVLH